MIEAGATPRCIQYILHPLHRGQTRYCCFWNVLKGLEGAEVVYARTLLVPVVFVSLSRCIVEHNITQGV